MVEITSKNNFCLTVTDAVHGICRPLFEHTEIHYLTYCRSYRDNRFIAFETAPTSAEWFLSTKQYNVARTTVNPNEQDLHDGMFLADQLDYSHPSLWNLKSIEENILQIRHPLLIMRSHADYNEAFTLFVKQPNSSINQWYMNNVDVLEAFAAYFREQAAPLIKEAEQRSIILSGEKLLTDSIGETRYKGIEVGKVSLEQARKNPDYIYQQYHALTARERECVYWLFNGKTVPEIATILGLSKRTVEKYISYIKEKFECYTLFQLGDALSSMRNKLMLMEKLRIKRK
jgi:hypothetical protein